MASKTIPILRRRMVRELLLYGLFSGVLILIVNLLEYRFLVVERSVQLYGVAVAVLFVGLGIWLGLTLKRRKEEAARASEALAAAGPFARDEERVQQLGITPRELEMLGLIANGLSNREIAERLFISENTVKTHLNRLFDKLGAKRRTQAVQLGKSLRLIP